MQLSRGAYTWEAKHHVCVVQAIAKLMSIFVKLDNNLTPINFHRCLLGELCVHCLQSVPRLCVHDVPCVVLRSVFANV